MLSVGIVGLPNVGKTTLFNTLCEKEEQKGEAANYPFCTIRPKQSAVPIPDPHLEPLGNLSNSEEIVPAHMLFTDIAGLVEGASKGEGLGNQFLADIRQQASVLIHVVRCFEDPNIAHVREIEKPDPAYDIDIINIELILADLQVLETIHKRLEKQARGKKEAQEELVVIEKMRAHLEKDEPLRSCVLSEEEQKLVEHYPFITQKPVIYVANIAEKDLSRTEDNVYLQAVEKKALEENATVIPLCVKMEAELAQLEDPTEFLEELGLKEPALDKLIRASVEKLGLITFLTTGEKETRAWIIPKGICAKQAAGAIHSDIAKGFIRAKVIDADTLIALGTEKAEQQGCFRIEGKDYIVQEGDVIVFFHN